MPAAYLTGLPHGERPLPGQELGFSEVPSPRHHPHVNFWASCSSALVHIRPGYSTLWTDTAPARHTTWQQSTFHSDSPLSQASFTRHSLHHCTALGSLSWRSGKGGGDSWIAPMMPRYQHGLLTKRPSAVIYPHPLRLVHSVACEQSPVQSTGGATHPVPGTRSMVAKASAGSLELHQVTR